MGYLSKSERLKEIYIISKTNDLELPKTNICFIFNAKNENKNKECF